MKKKRNVLKEIQIILTDAERLDRAKQAAEHHKELGNAEYLFDEIKRKHKETSDRLQNAHDRLLRAVRDGCEFRDEMVIEEYDFDAGEVIDWYNDKIVNKRPLRPDERQEDLFPRKD